MNNSVFGVWPTAMKRPVTGTSRAAPLPVARARWFPELDPDEWRETAREAHAPDERNPYPYAFVTLERTGPTTVDGRD